MTRFVRMTDAVNDAMDEGGLVHVGTYWVASATNTQPNKSSRTYEGVLCRRAEMALTYTSAAPTCVVCLVRWLHARA